MKSLIIKSLENSYSYKSYREYLSELLSQGLSSGNTQSEELNHYSALNEVRMNRLDKTITIDNSIKQTLEKLTKKYIWLVISEGWCGDAAQIVPVLNKMAEASSGNIDLRIVLRDENELLMNEFLTNGAKSIPKVIVINKESLEVEAIWGPRPEGATTVINNFKQQFGQITGEAKTELQKWYLNDKGLQIQQELINSMSIAKEVL